MVSFQSSLGHQLDSALGNLAAYLAAPVLLRGLDEAACGMELTQTNWATLRDPANREGLDRPAAPGSSWSQGITRYGRRPPVLKDAPYA